MSHPPECLRLRSSRVLFILSACAPPTPFISAHSTPRPSGTQNTSATNTPAPAASSLKVEKEALRGVQINVWHPWFGAEASLFSRRSQSSIRRMNGESLSAAQSTGNYSELFLQTDAAVENSNLSADRDRVSGICARVGGKGCGSDAVCQ